jgi:DNA polymerase I-like protein with 3'-5' exonuclease and polymerase domains
MDGGSGMDKLVFMDLETGGLEARYDPSVPVWCAAWHALGHHDDGITDSCKYTGDVSQEEFLYVLKHTVEYMINVGYKLVFHNASFDVAVLRTRGINIPEGSYYCSLVLAHCFDSQGLLSLKDWAERGGIAGHKVHIDNDDWKRGWTPQMEERCKSDVLLCREVWRWCTDYMDVDRLIHYKLTAMPAVEAVIEMEHYGITIDTDTTANMLVTLTDEMQQLEGELRSIIQFVPGEEKTYARGSFRGKGNHVTLEPFTPKDSHVGAYLVLSGVEGLEYDEQTKPLKGVDNPDLCYPIMRGEVMSTYNSPVVPLYSEWKRRQKLVSTFLTTWLEKSDEHGQLRCSFNQTGTVTGRFSSSKPNLQNIPARGELGSKLRSLVVAKSGRALVTGDLSNIEGRILAHLLLTYLGCSKLSDVFVSGGDFHAMNSEAFGLVDFVHSLKADEWDDTKIRKVARDIAKTALYAVLYGAGVKAIYVGASRGTGLSLTSKHGELILDNMKQGFPEVFDLKTHVIEQARTDGGKLHTIMGRTLKYPSLCYKSKDLRARAERQVFNAALQSPAGDILCRLIDGMRGIRTSRGLDANLICQVHDELLFDVSLTDADEVARLFTEYTHNTSYLGAVGNPMEFKSGTKWSDTK